MYFHMDYYCFVNQLYHKTKIICKKGATCKKKQGYFNFDFELREGDFNQYKRGTLPTSPGLASPDFNLLHCKLWETLHLTRIEPKDHIVPSFVKAWIGTSQYWFMSYIIEIPLLVLNKKNKLSKFQLQSMWNFGPCRPWGLHLCNTEFRLHKNTSCQVHIADY